MPICRCTTFGCGSHGGQDISNYKMRKHINADFENVVEKTTFYEPINEWDMDVDLSIFHTHWSTKCKFDTKTILFLAELAIVFKNFSKYQPKLPLLFIFRGRDHIFRNLRLILHKNGSSCSFTSLSLILAELAIVFKKLSKNQPKLSLLLIFSVRD